MAPLVDSSNGEKLAKSAKALTSTLEAGTKFATSTTASAVYNSVCELMTSLDIGVLGFRLYDSIILAGCGWLGGTQPVVWLLLTLTILFRDFDGVVFFRRTMKKKRIQIKQKKVKRTKSRRRKRKSRSRSRRRGRRRRLHNIR